MASCTSTAIPEVQKIQLAKSQCLSLFHSLSVGRCSPEENVMSSKEGLWGLFSTEFMRDHTQNLSNMACGYVLFSLQFSRHLSKGMERREEKRGREKYTSFYL